LSILPSTVQTFIKKTRPEEVIERASAPSGGFGWRFFAINPGAEYQRSAETLMGDRISQFSMMAQYIENLEPFKKVRVRGVDNALRLSSLAYLSIISMRGYLRHEEEDERPFNRLRQKVMDAARNEENAVRVIPELMASATKRDLESWLSEPNARNELISTLRRDGAQKAATAVIARLTTEAAAASLLKTVAEAIESNAVLPIRLTDAAKDCTKYLREALGQTLSTVRKKQRDPLSQYRELKVGESPQFSISFKLADALRKAPKLTDALDGLLTKKRLGTFADLVGNYLPKWADKELGDLRESFIDHGLASALVAVTASWEYESCLQLLARKPKDPHETVTVRRLVAALGLVGEADRSRLSISTKLLRSYVAEAITLHNLYPSDLKANPSYRTELQTQAVSYIAILADSLQRWDRPMLADESTSHLGGLVTGNRYNLVIEDEVFHISLVGQKADVEQQRRMRDDLQAYLKDADLYIHLKLEEQ
jgi:hypothetical protein